MLRWGRIIRMIASFSPQEKNCYVRLQEDTWVLSLKMYHITARWKRDTMLPQSRRCQGAAVKSSQIRITQFSLPCPVLQFVRMGGWVGLVGTVARIGPNKNPISTTGHLPLRCCCCCPTFLSIEFRFNWIHFLPATLPRSWLLPSRFVATFVRQQISNPLHQHRQQQRQDAQVIAFCDQVDHRVRPSLEIWGGLRALWHMSADQFWHVFAKTVTFTF